MKKRLPIFIVVAGVMLFFINCNKTTISSTTQLRVINVDPGSQPQDLYLDGTLMVPSAVAYGLDTNVYTVIPGTYNFKIGPNGSTSYSVNSNIDFSPGKNYLMFLLHLNDTLQPVVAEVNLPILGSDTSGVRFLNLSPNSPTMDIAIKSDTAVVYDTAIVTKYIGRYYNDQYVTSIYKNFITMPSGPYNFKFRYTDSTLAIDSMDINLLPGKCYTIYRRGYAGSTSYPVITDTIVH